MFVENHKYHICNDLYHDIGVRFEVFETTAGMHIWPTSRFTATSGMPKSV